MPVTNDLTKLSEQLSPSETRTRPKKPPLYKVILLNDNYTPMEFVVGILQAFFLMDRARATTLMLKVHKTGRAVCGLYTRDVAETKMLEINNFSRSRKQPLLCVIEPN